MKRAEQMMEVMNELRRRGFFGCSNRMWNEVYTFICGNGKDSSEKKRVEVEQYQHGVRIRVLCRGFYGTKCVYAGFIDCAAQEARRNMVIANAIRNYNSIM